MLSENKAEKQHLDHEQFLYMYFIMNGMTSSADEGFLHESSGHLGACMSPLCFLLPCRIRSCPPSHQQVKVLHTSVLSAQVKTLMHNELKPIERGKLGFRNFASHFIHIQIFQMEISSFSFILSAPKYCNDDEKSWSDSNSY